MSKIWSYELNKSLKLLELWSLQASAAYSKGTKRTQRSAGVARLHAFTASFPLLQLSRHLRSPHHPWFCADMQLQVSEQQTLAQLTQEIH